MWLDAETQARIEVGNALKRQQAVTDTSCFREFRAFRTDAGWYETYWLREAPRRPKRSGARWIIKLGKACLAVARIRRAASEIPSEGSACLSDEVERARELMLGVKADGAFLTPPRQVGTPAQPRGRPCPSVSATSGPPTRRTAA